MKRKKHKLGTYKINKISLPCLGDKKYILNEGIKTWLSSHQDICLLIKAVQLFLVFIERRQLFKIFGQVRTPLYFLAN